MSNREKDFEALLQDPELNQEIGPDELAIHGAGLTHPDDLALEQILAEDWESVPDHEEAPLTPEEALNQFLYSDEGEEKEEAQPVSTEPTQVIPEIPEEMVDAPEYSEEEPIQAPVSEPDYFFEPDASDPDDTPDDSGSPSKPINPNHKGRPKWKKGYGLLGIPHILVTAVWLAITVAIGVSLGRILWVCCADVMSFGKPEVTAYVEVTDDDTIETISQKLADAKLVRYPGLFQKFAEITKKDDRIKTGVYELGSHLDYNAMINNMVYTGSSREEVKVTFPEGYNCAQIFRLLEENNVCSVADLEEWAANGELGDYWFLEGVERGSKYCLEGYLSPDTYMFYTGSEPQVVLEKFLDAFDARFTDIMKEDFETMKERYAKLCSKNGVDMGELTLHQVLTIASVVERETANDAESYQIASVFYNRVTDPSVRTMGSDATVYYALPGQFDQRADSCAQCIQLMAGVERPLIAYAKVHVLVGELTEADLAVDSPYNTRKAAGIPPGPICNPGAYSLYAALDPDDTNYLYFIYDSANSKHLFSTTYSEHLQKAEELGE